MLGRRFGSDKKLSDTGSERTEKMGPIPALTHAEAMNTEVMKIPLVAKCILPLAEGGVYLSMSMLTQAFLS